jgi:hypothetical protein
MMDSGYAAIAKITAGWRTMQDDPEERISMTKLLIGPVLSFRGTDANGTWKVTALIGIDDKLEPPALTLGGRKGKKPVMLLRHGGCAYLRYDLSCKMTQKEQLIAYAIEGIEESWQFTLPAKGQAPRMAYVSCNGFSDPNGMRKLIRAENAVWADLLCNHDKTLRPPDYALDKEQLWHESRSHDAGHQRFHLMLMGGDQLYFDSIWEDIKALKSWVGLPRGEQLEYVVTPALEREIENYYFQLYSQRWLPPRRSPWGSAHKALDDADAMARIPTVMMWDDHDIFDGWGSYSPEMQRSPLFRTLFFHARRAFWVLQMQHAIENIPELTRRTDVRVRADDPLFEPIKWSSVLSKDKLALPLLDDQPGFSYTHSVGPVSLVVADLRTERSQHQILGPDSWRAMQEWLAHVNTAGSGQSHTACRQLLFMSSVPVIHPKLSLAEAFMDGFGQDNVLDSSADDLKDHWTNDDHEGERKRLVENLLNVARQKALRVTIVSGDAHVATWGVVYRTDVDPTDKWAQIPQLTSSAVVHPSLVSVMERLFFHVLNQTAKSKQALDVNLDAEMMLFPGSNRYVMATRNWLAIELDSDTGTTPGNKLWAAWRCESRDSFSNHLLAIEPVDG